MPSASDAAGLPLGGPEADGAARPQPGLWEIVRYFLLLGLTGFGGVAALAGYMHRDLVDKRRWFDQEEFDLAFGLAQLVPGPMATQLAIALCYFRFGWLPGVLSALAICAAPFVIIVSFAVVYVAFESAAWLQAIFYGAAAGVVAVMAYTTARLGLTVNKRSWLLWLLAAATIPVTLFLPQVNLMLVLLLAGCIAVLVDRVPFPNPDRLRAVAWPFLMPLGAALPALTMHVPLLDVAWQTFLLGIGSTSSTVFEQIDRQFVTDLKWLTETQYVDAVAIQLLTPGPPFTAPFVGYMAAGLPGAFAGAIGYLLPVIGLAIVPAAVFVRYRTSRALTVCFQGVAAAGVGALLATVVTFGRASLVDVPAVVIAAVGLGVLVLRLPIPVVLFGSAGVGLLLRVTSWWPG